MSFGKHNFFAIVYAAAWVLILTIWFLKSLYSPVFNGHVSAYKKPGQTLKKLSSNSVLYHNHMHNARTCYSNGNNNYTISSVILLLVLDQYKSKKLVVFVVTPVAQTTSL